jgi:hypothetical protein
MKLNIACLSFILVCACLAAEPLSVREIEPPAGYTVMSFGENTFSAWIMNLGLKQGGAIHLYDGSELGSGFFSVLAIVDKPLLFKQNLEQCADFCMRLWADFHKETNALAGLYLFNYGGSRVTFYASKKNYLDFLKQAFGYSNSYSLKQGCNRVKAGDLKPGDMFVQNRTGGIGHVSMIVSACENPGGEKLFLIGYSFMPAQEFHIERAADSYGVGGWFSVEGYRAYLKEYLDFGDPVLCRF